MIYLDYNATAPLRPGVKAAMEEVANLPLNPSSVHAAGRHAKKLLEDARSTIASSVSAFSNEVLFVGSGTEANNMVLRAFAPTHTLLVSAIEHASISKTAALLGGAVVPVDSVGVVKLDILEQMLRALGGKPVLISVMLANNETGVIQPIAEIARIAHAHGALVHCDAVQALGKIPLDWGLLGVDMLTINGHKAGGPVGVAALLIRNDLPIKPLHTGGGQELGRRAGTENISAIVGFAECVKEVTDCSDAAQWSDWRAWLVRELISAAPDAVVMGSSLPRRGRGGVGADTACGQDDSNEFSASFAPLLTSPLRGEEHSHLPQTLNITMPGVKAETQLMNFDLAGFAVSAGSACSSGRIATSHVLRAMGVPEPVAECAIRISWGWGTTHAEIEQIAAAWKAMSARLVK